MATLDGGNEESLRARIAELEEHLVSTHASLTSTHASLTSTHASLASTRESLARVIEERDRLRRAYAALKEHYELLRRQIFAAKAERIDAGQLALEFAETKAKLDAMAEVIAEQETASTESDSETHASTEPLTPPVPPSTGPKKRPKPKGRRDLAEELMPETRIVITDPLLEGQAPCIGFEDSFRYGYRRAGPVRVKVARATYKVTCEPEAESEGEETFAFVTAKTPKEMIDRGLIAPSLGARLLVSKYRFGVPFHRLVEMLRSDGIRLDDGTMCRYAEHVGATLGCIVEACVTEAKETAFCLSTDATGVAIQPVAVPGKRQACRKGHFFVVLADQDHVFFEFQKQHTSDAVCAMFKGFTGYVQADAHAVYDALFRGKPATLTDAEVVAPDEVGCWAHARRKFFEAATVAKDAASREGLLRLRILFELEESWAKLPPSQRHALRQRIAGPMLEDFFAWADGVFANAKGVRGLVATAFGYAVRQKAPLCRFLDDARLPLTNNHSERALRPICAGRHAWLFFGSDDHASAAANLFSLIASCKLHNLDAETYLPEMIRIVPLWPRHRFLELAPKYWARTRARLLPEELVHELGPITVPPPLPTPEKPPPE